MNLITPDTSHEWNHTAFVFCDWLLALRIISLSLSFHIVACDRISILFKTSNTLLCMCMHIHMFWHTTFCYSVHLLMDIWVASSFWILWTAWLWTWVCRYLFEILPLVLLNMYLIVGYYGNFIFNFLSNCYFYSDNTIYLCSNQQGTRSSSFSHHQQYLFCFLNSSLRSVRWSHYGFDLHFSNSQWYWASFYMLVGHLYIIFGENSNQVPCPYF